MTTQARQSAEAAVLVERMDAFARALRATDEESIGGLLEFLVPGGALDAVGAVEVHRSGYLARLTEQLGETYAGVWRAVGDESFCALAERYIAAHPSCSPNLSDYGREFPAFLEADPSWVGEEAMDAAPVLGELARLELCFHDLFHAESHRAADVSEARALAERGDLGGVRLEFGGALRLLRLRRAVYDLFRARHEAIAPALDTNRPQRLMLFRQEGEVRAVELGLGTFTAMEGLVAGLTIDEALEEGARCDAEFGEAQAADLLRLLVSCAVVTRWG
jgi:hypothetical protein